MQIENNILITFLNKASLKGNMASVQVDFAEDGVYARSRTADNTAMVGATLKKEAFDTYTPLGKMHIKNVALLIAKLQKLVKGKVALKVEDNTLVVADENKRSFEDRLASEETAENAITQEQMEAPLSKFDEGATLKKEVINDTLSGSTVMQATQLWIESTGTQMKITNLNDNKEKAVLEYDVTYKTARTSFNPKLFKDVVSAIQQNEFNLSIMGDAAPIKLHESDEHMSTTVILAPSNFEE